MQRYSWMMSSMLAEKLMMIVLMICRCIWWACCFWATISTALILNGTVFPCPSACYRYLLSIHPLKKSIVQRQEKNIFICRVIYSQLLFMGLNCWHSMCKAVLKCVFSVFLSLWGYDVLWVICLDMLLLSLNGVSVAVNVYSGSLKGYNCLWCAKRSFQQLLTKTFLDVTKYFNRGPLQFSILFAVSTGKNAY